MPRRSQFLALRLLSPCKHEIIDMYDDFFGLILSIHSAANIGTRNFGSRNWI